VPSSALAQKRRQQSWTFRSTSPDIRSLNEVPAAGFHAVICMDNALSHFLNEADLTQAAGQIRAKLRIGGTFLPSIRDYDAILAQPPVVQRPAFYSDEGKRRIVFQVWDWQDERRYVFHMYITRETSAGWANFHGASAYRAVLREEITGILRRADSQIFAGDSRRRADSTNQS
jgi:hypothetical protein